MIKQNWLSDKEYDAIYSRVPRACVDIVIRSPRGIMFCYRINDAWKNTWGLPGGRLRFGETIFRGAVRIARAETGLRIKPIKIIGVMEFPHERQRGRPRHTVSVVILAAPDGGHIQKDATSKEVRSFDRLPPRPTRPHGEFLLAHKLIRR